jgi:cytochrome P450
MQEHTGLVLPPKYDAHDPAVMDDPYPTYARLRASGRVCRGGPGQWVVTHHADVYRLLRDQRLGNQYPAAYRQFSFGDTQLGVFFERIILNRDPPQHTYLRQLMNTAFGPAHIRKLTNRITVLVEQLFVPLLDRRSFDVVPEIAFTLPVLVVCELIGVPAQDREEVRPRAAELCKAFDTHLMEGQRGEVEAVLSWLRDYIGSMVRERTLHPGKDFLSALVSAAAQDRQLTQEDVVDNVVFLFFAGFETAKNLIATGFAALLAFPDQFVQLTQEPDLAVTATDEFLRYDAPIQVAGRFVMEALEIGGRLIQRDRVLTLLLGSANHDETVFNRPGVLDIRRQPNPHVAFGGGIHFCLGAMLARMEATAVFRMLAERVRQLAQQGPIKRQPSPTFRCCTHVPVTISPR